MPHLPRLDRAAVFQLLHEVDVRLEGTIPPSMDLHLVLLGGAAVIAPHGGRRWTHDTDVVVRPPAGTAYLQELGLHVVAQVLLNLPDDYEDRLVRIDEDFRHFSLWSLGPYDLAISKISRGAERDFFDIFEGSDLRRELDWDVLETLYRKAMPGWIGHPLRFETNLAMARRYWRPGRDGCQE